MAVTFGSALREQRMAHGLTQEALAERALLSPTAIAALERGRNRAPRMSTLHQLAKALELNPEEMADLARTLNTGPSAPTAVLIEEGPDGRESSSSAADAALRPVPSERRDRISLPYAASRRWRTDFVGRDDEIGRLRHCLGGGCRLVEVLGESGIGKTRLVSELVKNLEPATTVSWGRCSQDDLGSYMPFVEIIRHISGQLDDKDLAGALGGRGELTRLAPELTTRAGPLAAPTRAEADSEQRMLFDAVSGFLARWTPMVLVVDDLHWADAASLALLAYLVRDYGLTDVAVLVTARPTELSEQATGVLAELGRDVDSARIRLDGLPGAELARLIADLLGSAPPFPLVESVQSATDGNPFFAEELTVHLLDTGLVVDRASGVVSGDGSGRAGVPDRIRDMVAKRLGSMSGQGVDVLSVGAVIGREFDVALAGSALGIAGLPLVDAADDALLSGMVVETGPGRLGFSHALLRDAVGERLSQMRRASVHRAVAQALEELGSSPEQRAAELARHWAAVAEVDPAASVAAATWAVRAGDQALAAAAAEEAIARYEQAVTLWSVTSRGHVDSLVRLGIALHYRGRADDADERFKEAMALAVAIRDPVLQARAAVGFGRRYPYWETDTTRITALEAALVELPPDEMPLRTMLMGLLVTHLINGFRPDQASRRDALADELSSVLTAPDATTDVLLAVGQTRVYDCIEDPAALDGVADRLIAVAAAHNDLKVEATARFSKALAALDRGRMDVLRTSTERYADVSARLGDPRDQSQAATVRSTIAYIEGRYQDAAELSDEALELGRTSGDFNADLIHYAQGLLRAIDLGLAADVLPLLLASTEFQVISSFDAGTALCAALAGDHDEAGARLTRLVETGFSGAPRGADFLTPTAFLADTSVLVGDPAAAEAVAAWFRRTRSTVVRVGPLAGWWGPVDHHLGCVAQLLGRSEEAETRLRHALEVERDMNARPFSARTLAYLAAAVAGRSRAEADRTAADAFTEAEQLDAPGIVEEVKGVLASAGLAG
jgi:transcriptional regulator with XRE-family HTH domain/tetratricopeptide (TPR) repeat protein